MMQQQPEVQRSASRAQSLSCTTCRSRKVKCDHRKPLCSGCEKYGVECVWPERRKSSTRKEKKLYENIVARLAQMERLVEELQEQPQGRSSGSRQPAASSKPSAPTPEKSPTSTSSTSGSAASGPSAPTHSSPTFPPSPALSSPRASKLYYSGAASEATIGTAGSCSLFSSEGIARIDSLVGDGRFSDAVRSLLQKIRGVAPQRSIEFDALPRDHTFPSNDVVVGCLDDFFQTLNSGIKLLQESEVRAAVQAYMYGQTPQQPGWRMALNVILVHSLRTRDWAHGPREHEKYLYNALSLIPTAILQPPNPMTIGALLSLSAYFIFTAENHIAVSILAVATQLILLAGYHNPDHPCKTRGPASEVLRRRRLFWQAYIMDHDLMLRIGKPPLISDEFLMELPEEYPLDGYNVYYFPGNVTLSYFYQQVRLSQIQGRIFSRLYSKSGGVLSAAALESEIALLDAELQEWREGIPEVIRPDLSVEMLDGDYGRLMSLTVLHFVYFQLVVAVHSAAFRLPLVDDDDEMDGLRPSVALCVNAARAAISLLNHQRLQHPFTIYLLYQVAWSVDILFVSILENKTSAASAQDLQLIRKVLDFFETYDWNHQRVASYHIIKALYGVASSVVTGSSGMQSPTPTLTAATTTMAGFPQDLIPQTTCDEMDAMTANFSTTELEFGGDWGNISFGNHEWLGAGFLQMTDWGFPANQYDGAGQYEGPDSIAESHG